MSESIMVTVQDARELKYCVSGMRTFALKNNLDWRKFLSEGLPIEQLEAVDDAMMQHLCKYVRSKQEGAK